MNIIYISNIGTSDLGYRESDTPLFDRRDNIYELSKKIYSECLEKKRNIYELKPLLIEDQIKKIFELESDVNKIYVVLFATRQNPPKENDTIYIAEIIKDLLEGKFKNISVDTFLINRNPANYDEMLDSYLYELSKLEIELQNIDKIYINITGGTPAMITALLMISIAKWGDKIKVFYKPKNTQDSKLLSIGKRIYNIYQRKQFEILKEKKFYNLAAEKLKEIEGKETCEYHYLMGLYYLDLFNFEDAENEFNESKKNIEEFPDLSQNIKKRLKEIELLKNGNQKIKRLLKLYLLVENALSKYEKGEYVDFIGRTFRIYEDLLRFIFEELTEVSTDKKGKGFPEFENYLNNNKEIIKYLNNEGWNGDKKPTTWVLNMIIKYFLEKEEYKEKIKKEYGVYIGYLNMFEKCRIAELRNKSIIAHGYDGIKKLDISDNLINQLERLKDKIEKELNSYL
jgi:hypothetical protein